MAATAEKSSFRPSVLVKGWEYLLTGPAVIGRVHVGCPLEDCQRKGFSTQPEIPIWDKYRYIGRHHARIWVDPSGTCRIEDLHSLNGTAILRASKEPRAPTFFFEKLSPDRGYVLLNGDLVGLAFSPHRGPYLTFSYRTD